MTKETSSEKQTHRQVESQRLDLDTVGLESDTAYKAACEKVKQGLASAHYEYRDNIRDFKHLSHITIIALDDTVLYNQDFVLERQSEARVDPNDN